MPKVAFFALGSKFTEISIYFDHLSATDSTPNFCNTARYTDRTTFVRRNWHCSPTARMHNLGSCYEPWLIWNRRLSTGHSLPDRPPKILPIRLLLHHPWYPCLKILRKKPQGMNAGPRGLSPSFLSDRRWWRRTRRPPIATKAVLSWTHWTTSLSGFPTATVASYLLLIDVIIRHWNEVVEKWLITLVIILFLYSVQFNFVWDAPDNKSMLRLLALLIIYNTTPGPQSGAFWVV